MRNLAPWTAGAGAAVVAILAASAVTGRAPHLGHALGIAVACLACAHGSWAAAGSGRAMAAGLSIIAFSAPMHAASDLTLWLAWAPLTAALVPPRPAAAGAVAAVLAGLHEAIRGWGRIQGPAVVAVAALVATAIAVGRPRSPTGGQLAVLRESALLVPGLAFAMLFTWNAATRRFEGMPVRDVLLDAVAGVALLVLLSAALLGASTLLEGRHPREDRMWTVVAAAGGFAAAVVVAEMPGYAVASLGGAAVPTAILGGIGVRRLLTSPRWLIQIWVGAIFGLPTLLLLR